MASYAEETEKIGSGWYGQAVEPVASITRPLLRFLPAPEAVTGNLNSQWASDDDIYSGAFALPDRKQAVGNLDSKMDRLHLLDQLTQNDTKEGDPGGASASWCGSSVILAAAIQGDGMKGVQALFDQVAGGLQEDSPIYQEQKDKLDKMRKAMEGGNLDLANLHDLTGILNVQLQQRQIDMFAGMTNEDGSPIDLPARGLDPRVLKDFIGKNEKLKGYFGDGKMSIDSVDADGQTPKGASNGGDHFVLHMGGENGSAIYDPFARKDHHQLVFNPAEQENYRRHEVRDDQIDGADFGASPYHGMYD